MRSAGFELTVPASDRPQALSVDPSTTGIGVYIIILYYVILYYIISYITLYYIILYYVCNVVRHWKESCRVLLTCDVTFTRTKL